MQTTRRFPRTTQAYNIYSMFKCPKTNTSQVHNIEEIHTTAHTLEEVCSLIISHKTSRVSIQGDSTIVLTKINQDTKLTAEVIQITMNNPRELQRTLEIKDLTSLFFAEYLYKCDRTIIDMNIELAKAYSVYQTNEDDKAILQLLGIWSLEELENLSLLRNLVVFLKPIDALRIKQLWDFSNYMKEWSMKQPPIIHNYTRLNYIEQFQSRPEQIYKIRSTNFYKYYLHIAEHGIQNILDHKRKVYSLLAEFVETALTIYSEPEFQNLTRQYLASEAREVENTLNRLSGFDN
ncbi:MAG: hypothetical protein ATN35_08520 [Epulopiscium sp. Nele67-Bin004]|nr:MAG: hypothetical protein ATN35_08520 [Epulopiscium sp. Nele67-Bin004]